jgi:hypothetical protein
MFFEGPRVEFPGRLDGGFDRARVMKLCVSCGTPDRRSMLRRWEVRRSVTVVFGSSGELPEVSVRLGVGEILGDIQGADVNPDTFGDLNWIMFRCAH